MRIRSILPVVLIMIALALAPWFFITQWGNNESAAARPTPTTPRTPTHPRPTTTTASTTTTTAVVLAATSPTSDVVHSCWGGDTFCVDFPSFAATDPIEPHSFGDRNAQIYESTLYWSRETKVFCSSYNVPDCKYVTADGETFTNADHYAVVVWVAPDPDPWRSLEMATERGYRPARTTFAGEPAMTDEMWPRSGGHQRWIYVYHNGKIYELDAANPVDEPLFIDQFFNSFTFTP